MFFINTRCKARFYNNSNFTFFVQKDSIDLIFKIRRGIYLTVSVYSLSDDRCLLLCAWGNFWNRIKGMKNQKNVLVKLERHCPLSASIFANSAKPHFAFIDSAHTEGAIVSEIKMTQITNTITDYLHHDIIKKAIELMEFNLNVQVELEEHCPFPLWKQDLKGMMKSVFVK